MRIVKLGSTHVVDVPANVTMTASVSPGAPATLTTRGRDHGSAGTRYEVTFNSVGLHKFTYNYSGPVCDAPPNEWLVTA